MLELSKHITLDKETIESPNLCSQFSEEDLQKIAEWCHQGYSQDKASREKWERRTAAGMDLAMQITKPKNHPWPNCSNVAFPLVTIAVTQFQSMAYPALISGPEVVKARVIGADPDGKKVERARRIARHMSYQVLEEDEDWEEQHDRTIINVSCVGTAFKKSYFCEDEYNQSDLVMAKDLVLDYYAKSVEQCPRKTHLIPLYRNEVYERVRRGTFRDVLGEEWYTSPQPPKQRQSDVDRDRRHGTTPPATTDETTPFIFLEQHVGLDLDGDGYAEPYIITLEENSKSLVRIVTRFNREEDIERDEAGRIICINAMEYFTKYGFIPSPDGGIYDIGFGVLLGPINESVNTSINQIFDAGTQATTAGGFLGRGAKMRGGVIYFSPFGWNRVDSSGDDLRKSIVPFPVREPSVVLFQLLSLLINYANRVSGSTDAVVGENLGQNTPAETSRTMLQMGIKVYSAILKRLWRSMKAEFKKLYVLNARYMLPDQDYSYGDKGEIARREDYLGDPREVVPAADPTMASEIELIQRATAVKAAAATTPGYDPEAVEVEYLRALKVADIERIYPGPKKIPPPPNLKLQIAQMRTQETQLKVRAQLQMAALKLMEEHRLNTAKILQLEAQAVKLIEEAGGVRTGQQIQAFNAAIGALKVHNDALFKQIEILLEGTKDVGEGETSGSRTRADRGRVEQLADSSGNEGLALPSSEMAAGGPGEMGGGGPAA